MGKPKSTINQKVQWLVSHPQVWRGWPVAPNTDAEIMDLMRKDGLISEGAHNFDIMDFGKLISKAREIIAHERK